MTIVDRYLFKKVITGFIMALVSFFFLYILIDLFSQLQDFLKAGSTPGEIATYYALLLPSIFVQVTPIAFLLGALYTMAMLNKQNEMISLRTQGASPASIARVFLIMALLISAFSLYIDNELVPPVSIRLERAGLEPETDKKKQAVVENFHFYSKLGHVVFAHRFDPATGTITNANIFLHDESGETAAEVIAEQVTWDGSRWIAHHAMIYRVKDNRIDFDNASSEREHPLPLNEPPREVLRRAQLKWTNLSLQDIDDQIEDFNRWKASRITRLLRVEYHRKIAQNFSLFFLLLGALPFALRIQQRRAGVSALALTLTLCFSYYFLFSLCLALGKTDFFHPAIAAWLTNIFFGVEGAVGLRAIR